jgi:hypothetical protein
MLKEQRWRVLRRLSSESRNWRISWRRLSHGGVGGVVETISEIKVSDRFD